MPGLLSEHRQKAIAHLHAGQSVQSKTGYAPLWWYKELKRGMLHLWYKELKRGMLHLWYKELKRGMLHLWYKELKRGMLHDDTRS